MNTPTRHSLAAETTEPPQPPRAALLKLKQLYGVKLEASNGQIGHVKDFLFTDQDWIVRYIVADTGSWLSERLVLLSPQAFTDSFQQGGSLVVNLTREQIEQSPSLEAHKPVSRQQEEEYYRHYGYTNYWNEGAAWGLGVYPMTAPMPIPSERPVSSDGNDPHLRSTQALSGYLIQNREDVLGHVTDFFIDFKAWAVRYLIGTTGKWFGGDEILILPNDVDRISYDESKVSVHTTKDLIQAARDCHDMPENSSLPKLPTEISGHSLFSDR